MIDEDDDEDATVILTPEAKKKILDEYEETDRNDQ